MEFLFNYKTIEDDYNEFNSDIEQLKELLKNNERNKNLYDLFLQLKEKDIYLYFILFHNFENWININFENNNNIEKINKIEILLKYIKLNKLSSNIHLIFIVWVFYLYVKLINCFNFPLKTNYLEINKLRCSLKETCIIISKLYKSELLFNEFQMFDFIDLIYFLLESNFLQKSFSDKTHKAKNYILFNELFFLLKQNIIVIFSNKIPEDKKQKEKKDKSVISKFFKFLQEFKNDKEIISYINKSVLINKGIIQKFIDNIFGNVNFIILQEYEPNFKNILSEFLIEIFKNNYRKSGIYDSILSYIRQSFINLYDFEKNKNKIIHDLFINSFYSNILKQLLYPDESVNNVPEFDCFYFNGFDSQISLSIENNNFEKSSIFFSFNLVPIKERNKYPLFLIQKDFDKNRNDLLKIYLQKDDKDHCFYLYEYHENKEIKIDYQIKAYTTYYICICFNNDQLLIKLYDPHKTIFIFSSPNITKSNKLLSIKSILLSFGYYKKKAEIFSGYIGPIMCISNPKQIKNLDDFISSVLKLGKKYKNFLIYSQNMEYIEENDLIFHSTYIQKNEYKLDKQECLLYLVPQNFIFFNEQPSVVNRIPFDENFCTLQNNYNIRNFNVTLTKYENEIYEFINDNGLDYICLLYEYIYQFAENYYNSNKSEEDIENDQKSYLIYITNIFKDTLFIIEKIYHDVNIELFVKNLKQIYMNLFSSLNIIAIHSDIIDKLIPFFYDIIDNYHNYFSNFIKMQIKSNNEQNNNLSKTNLNFMNGWIDFLLNPDIYNYKNKEILISLFNHLSKYFIYIFANKNENKVNQTFYIKLISFLDYLYKNYEYEDDINIDFNYNKADVEKNVIDCEDEKNNIFNSFLKSLTSFYSNNPNKTENITNLKIMFKDINESLNENDKSYFLFYRFINKYINKDLEDYLNNEHVSEQISVLIKVVNNLIQSKLKLYLDKKENSNKCKIFDELINDITGLLMRIILIKENLKNNVKIIKNFILKNLEIPNELIPLILKEIKIIFSKYLLAAKKKEKTDNETTSNKEDNSKEKFDKLSDFYYSIFDIFKFILEDVNIQNENKINNEMEILNLFTYIIKIMRFDIEEKNKDDFSPNINIEYTNNFSDIIFCSINFLKFYNNILSKKIYSELFITNFIDLCNLCLNSGLIYSTILIDIKKNPIIKKTTLELILDTCFIYLNLCAEKYNIAQQNEETLETILKGQLCIYNFLEFLLQRDENKSKNITKFYSIFYINDHFRYLTSKYPKEGKKKPKDDEIYNEFKYEFNNMQDAEGFFPKNNKFNLNFSTYFILKCVGYNKLLTELSRNLSQNERNKEKNCFKYDDLLNLIMQVVNKNYKEQKLLFKSKGKNMFFPKPLNTPFKHYFDIKTRIEFNIKKNNYSEIDNFILNEIFNKDYINTLFLMNSGMCFDIKKDEKHESEKKGIYKKYNSSKFILTNIESNNTNSPNTYNSNDYNIQKNLLSGTTPDGSDSDILSEKNNRKNTEEINDFVLKLEEDTGQNEKSKNKIFEDISTNDTLSYKDKNDKINKNLFILNNTKTFNKRKISNVSFISNISNGSNSNGNVDNNVPYINYFFQPDEYLLRNSKKQLMMSVFSIYFCESFFENESFKLMKNYYIKNFTGIQNSTKLLNYPSKLKIFNNGLEPYLFVKPYSSFFETKIFQISHNYFYDYISKNNIPITEPIILYKKILPEFIFEDKFEKKCELIRLDVGYFGHIIGSKNINSNFIIFEKQKYKFYEEIEELKKNKDTIESHQKSLDLSELFTLSFIFKKPVYKRNKKKLQLHTSNKIKRFKRNKVIIILFDEIEEILERRFLLMWQAIEIILKNGKSYFFNFLSKEENTFILDIFKKNNKTKNKIKTKDYFLKNIKKLTREWEDEQLTTYEYLLFLNKFASRTYNDINQYPVFPWTIKKYITDKNLKENKFVQRNFNYPMASQNEDNRIIAYTRYEDEEKNKQSFPIHYGTHYSTSSYVNFYLMRQEPFTTLLIKLQGYKQEHPDRMFYSIIDTLLILESGHDNRECIPDIISKIEQFINLNCVNFGTKNLGIRVDDFNIYIYDEKKESDRKKLLNCNNYSISDYVNFIIQEHIYLNSTKIAHDIIHWFDLIFGVGQLPEKNRKESLNIFSEESYEQQTNLYKILNDLKEASSDPIGIINEVGSKIDLIISFGQTPSQILREKHPKFKVKKINKVKEEKDDELGFEEEVQDILCPRNYKTNINIQPIYFEIYPEIGKIFVIDIKRKLEIINTNYYDSEASELRENIFINMQLPHIKFFDKSKINNNYYFIKKQKYCLSPFRDKIPFDENTDTSLKLYYNAIIDNYNDKDNIDYTTQKNHKKQKKEEIIFITCRYPDNTFKIHVVYNDKETKGEKNFTLSVECEDFVSSVCTLDHNKFLVGLNNGKLIQYSLYKEKLKNDTKNEKFKLKIKLNRKIQAHKKCINVIEVNFRLGIIITAGEDNYLFIRKIYDLELLIPIKFKSKFQITMAKISPLNFLYVQCFNKKINNSIIFGYTLNGLYFAKSTYNLYDSLDFTKNGNIVTFVNKYEIEVLNGYDLKKIEYKKTDSKSDKNMLIIKEKLKSSSWATFNYLFRRNEIDNKIVKCISFSHFISEKKRVYNLLEYADASDFKMFD